MNDPLLTAAEAVKELALHGVRVHQKTLKRYALAGEVPAQRDMRPGTRCLMNAKWLFRKSLLLAAFGALRIANNSKQYHEIMARGGAL